VFCIFKLGAWKLIGKPFGNLKENYWAQPASAVPTHLTCTGPGSNRAQLAHLAERFSSPAKLAHRSLLRPSDPTLALSGRDPCFDQGSSCAAIVPTTLCCYPLMSTVSGQIFYSPPPFCISPTERSTASGAAAYGPCRRATRRGASLSHRQRALEDHHCVEHLLEPPSSERSPKAAGHFFTIRYRECLLVAGLLCPFSDPTVASPSSA
jgi:hypothetical protein